MAEPQPDSSEIGPAYLIAGTDEAKLGATVARLRARAESEEGPGSLESFSPEPGSSAAPDAEALVAAIPALSLTARRRYLLADGVERWSAKQAAPVIEALAGLPPEVTIVLVARELPSKLRAKKLGEAVEAAGGEVFTFQAPRAGRVAGWLVTEARRRGFALAPDAAALLGERIGDSTARLATELDRLALWAEPGGAVERDDLEAMIADSSEEVAWALSDAIVERDPASALEAAERLADQGGSVTPLIYQAAKQLRAANTALEQLEQGRSVEQVQAGLAMHPFAAEKLLRRLNGRSRREMRGATCAIADLEWWTRGGSDYPERVALTLAVRRAAGARGS